MTTSTPTPATAANPPIPGIRTRSSMRSLNIAVISLLLLLAVLFMLPGLPPWGVSAPMEGLLHFAPWQVNFPQADPQLAGSDIIFQQLPWHHWMQDELRAGRFPLWVSGPLGGYPLFAYYQAAALYPLHLLWALLPTGAGFGIILVLKLWIAGVGMWVFLRALNLRVSASLLGALGFMFSASLITWLPWSHTNVTILLPWLAWSVYAWQAEGKRSALPVFAVLLACALLGGSPEWFFIVVVVVAIWSFGLFLGSGVKAGWRPLTWLAVAAIPGLLVGAVQVLPFFEALNLSHISAIRPLSSVRAAMHLDAGAIINWVLPRFWGQVQDGVHGAAQIPNETNGYVGMVALLGLPMLVIAAFRKQLNLRLTLPWVAVTLLGWVVAYDDGVGTFIRGLPGFSQMVNGRFIMAVGFALVVLGAFGWDWFARWLEGRAVQQNHQPLQWAGIIGAGLFAVASLFLLAHLFGIVPAPNVGIVPSAPRFGVLHPPNTDYRLYWASWEAAILAGLAGAALLWLRYPRWWRAMPLAMGALLVADLWMLLYTYNPSAPAAWYYPQTTFISQLSAVPPTERILPQGEVLLTHTGLVYNFRDWRAQDPMITERALRASTFLDPNYRGNQWTRYNMLMSNIRLQVAPALGIRYFVFPADTDPNQPAAADPNRPAFKRLALADGLGLWEAEGAPGFAYLSDNVAAASGEPEAAQWMQNLTWEKIRAYPALVEAPQSEIAGIITPPDKGSPGSVTVDEYTPGHIKLTTDARRTSLLVVAESYYPGWHATLDGQPVPILRANYLSQGVVVPEGRHTIELKYEPDSVRNGAILSCVGLLGILGLTVWACRKPTIV